MAAFHRASLEHPGTISRKEIERIPDYKDVEEIAKWCDSKQNDMEKKERKLAVIRFIVLIFVIAFVAYGGTYLYSLIK